MFSFFIIQFSSLWEKASKDDHNQSVNILHQLYIMIELRSFNIFSSVPVTRWADSIQQSQCCITSILLVSFHPGISRQEGSEHLTSNLVPDCISSSDIMEPGESASMMTCYPYHISLIEFSWDPYRAEDGYWSEYSDIDYAILWHFPRHKDWKLSQKSSFLLQFKFRMSAALKSHSSCSKECRHTIPSLLSRNNWNLACNCLQFITLCYFLQDKTSG